MKKNIIIKIISLIGIGLITLVLYYLFYLKNNTNIELGVRPYYLVDQLDESTLKNKLSECKNDIFHHTNDFTIAHRGASLQIPEHTKESYIAGIKMGAGIVECDVSVTKDEELVCRHAQCDLHNTTDILLTPLAKKCTKDFIPYDEDSGTFANAWCCTSDITLKEFYSLKAKMNYDNKKAKTVEEYVNSVDTFQTNLYANDNLKLISHKDSIKLLKKYNIKMIPEIKFSKQYKGIKRTNLIDKLINEYHSENVNSNDIFIQSFKLDDLLYIIKKYPSLAHNVIYLKMGSPKQLNQDIKELKKLKQAGIQIISPPFTSLLSIYNNKIVPSQYAIELKKYNFKIITWGLNPASVGQENNADLNNKKLLNKNSDQLLLLDILDKEIEISGIFSDWPSVTTYYDNCVH